ncbi:hypothetical protein SGFS_062200 [Streptomyces graminofaciens]|uniref:Uncharacterized protein n=1 Tax=Streptomyces graminofaciens TaxID=68212 RepID=A0ABM7FFW4_9ACTN|nr:hypothetical protein [Streptomyces graminofaciens]BBC34926.1 hypothetical protein SGFS_062200 [Streptomyces graminofaciens]
MTNSALPDEVPDEAPNEVPDEAPNEAPAGARDEAPAGAPGEAVGGVADGGDGGSGGEGSGGGGGRAGGPRLAAELTTDDVWAIADFLLPLLEATERSHAPGTEEHRTASALAESVAALTLTLEHAIRGGGHGRVRVLADAPPPRKPSEEELRLRAEHRLTQIRESWNHLCAIAGFWKNVPGYDPTRWQEVRFRDTEERTRYERHAAELRARGMLGEPWVPPGTEPGLATGG